MCSSALQSGFQMGILISGKDFHELKVAANSSKVDKNTFLYFSFKQSSAEKSGVNTLFYQKVDLMLTNFQVVQRLQIEVIGRHHMTNTVDAWITSLKGLKED